MNPILVCGAVLLSAVITVQAVHGSVVREEDAGIAAYVQELCEKTQSALEEQPPEAESRASRSDWNLLLVNPWNALPAGFSVELESLGGGHSIDKRAAGELNAMLAAARAEGLSPLIRSSYRTHSTQKTLYANKVSQYTSRGYSRKEAEARAGRIVALPGTSEHEAGLAVDIVAASYQTLNERQERTAEQQWLMANSYKYGFILRYPAGKSEITGIIYEPWHYRYVGAEAAKEIYERGLCLEEYLDKLPQ
ncbi:MAG: M15 family metallopeptidase [Clostridia bacterium]|nr:M15 family metallopeptidase [Clostridia bacterium]